VRVKFLPLMTGSPQNLYATKDAELRSDLPNSNFPGHGSLIAGNYSYPPYYTKYNRFTLAFETALIDQSDILKAEIRLIPTGWSNEGNYTNIELFFHKILENWEDDQVTWNTQPAHEEDPFMIHKVYFADLDIEKHYFIEVQPEHINNFMHNGVLVKSREATLTPATGVGFSSRHNTILENQPTLILYLK